MSRIKHTKETAGLLHGFRSGLEDKIAIQIEQIEGVVSYELMKIRYEKPVTKHVYTPDFVLKNGIIVESKGRFLTADRMKHLLIKEIHPDLDIRFVFSNSKQKLSKTSLTSYGDWCLKNGYKYADKLIPLTWFAEERIIK